MGKYTEISIIRDALNRHCVAIAIHNERQILSIDDITCISAQKNDTIVHLVDKKQLLSNKPLNYYEEHLNSTFFTKVNRSNIINLANVAELNLSKLNLILKDEMEIGIGESYKPQFFKSIYSNLNIPVFNTKSFNFLQYQSVIYITANIRNSIIKTVDNQYINSNETLTEYEKFLDPKYFIRANRSFLINIYHIRTLRQGAKPFLTLRDNTRIDLEGKYKEKILAIFDPIQFTKLSKTVNADGG